MEDNLFKKTLNNWESLHDKYTLCSHYYKGLENLSKAIEIPNTDFYIHCDLDNLGLIIKLYNSKHFISLVDYLSELYHTSDFKFERKHILTTGTNIIEIWKTEDTEHISIWIMHSVSEDPTYLPENCQLNKTVTETTEYSISCKPENSEEEKL